MAAQTQVVLLLSLATVCLLCQLAATSQSGRKIAPNELKRIARADQKKPPAAAAASPVGGAKKATRRQRNTSAAARVKPIGGQQFVSRRSSVVEAEAAQQAAGEKISPRNDDHSPYSDTWNPHSLVPTFTDQEQGDEMVALASDQQDSPAESLGAGGQSKFASLIMPTQDLARQAPTGANNRTGAPPNESFAPAYNENSGAQRARATMAHLQDAYYNDEEDADEDEPMFAHLNSSAAAGADFAGDSYQTQQLFNQNEQFGFRPIAADSAPGEGSASQRANRSQLAMNQGKSENFGRDAPGNNGNGQQQRLPAQPQGVADKLMNLFAKGDSLSKTDAAIEYLKGLLKSKQQQASHGNLTEAQFNKQQAEQNQPNQATKFFSQLPMRIVSHSNVTQTFFAPSNETADFQSSSRGASAKLDEPQTFSGNQMQQVEGQQTSKQLFAQLAAEQQLSSATSAAKFSISDARQSPPKNSNVQQNQAPRLSTPAASQLASAMLRGEEELLPQADMKHPNRNYDDNLLGQRQQQAAAEQRNSRQQLEAQQPLAPPNGTPLGGDYIESLDDFRRQTWQQSRQAEQKLASFVEQNNKNKSVGEFAAESVETMASEAAKFKPLQVQAAKSSRFFRMPVGGDQLIGYAPVQQQADGGPLREVSPVELAAEGQYSDFYNRSKAAAKQSAAKGEQSGEQLFDAEAHIAARVREQEAKFLGVADSSKQNNRSKEEAEEFSSVGQQQQPLPQIQVNNKASPAAKLAPRQPVQQQQQQQLFGQPANSVFANQDDSAALQQPLNQVQMFIQQQQQLKPMPPTKTARQVDGQPQRAQQQQSQSQSQSQQPQPQLRVESQQQQPNEQQSELPKIVSYNYFESSNEPQAPAELLATNYALSDALYTSTGRVEHMLSKTELDAIRGQFSSGAEQPVVPLGQQPAEYQPQAQQAGVEPTNFGQQQKVAPSPHHLQRLNSSPEKYAEEVLKELASEEQQQTLLAAAADQQQQQHFPAGGARQTPAEQLESQSSESAPINLDANSQEPKNPNKKKSLIVYLNHPRPNEMGAKSEAAAANEGGDEVAQLVGEQNSGSQFVTAKEFDSLGLSKSSKQLDVASLADLSQTKDKDGLSVVVIGDAYKYKKIVLLISSKSGGLKFIPMVKDMKR